MKSKIVEGGRATFRAWLEQQDQYATPFRQGDTRRCPLACYAGGSVTLTSHWLDTVDGTVRVDLPEWAQRFVDLWDRKAAFTVKNTLEVLNGIK